MDTLALDTKQTLKELIRDCQTVDELEHLQLGLRSSVLESDDLTELRILMDEAFARVQRLSPDSFCEEHGAVDFLDR